MAKQELKTKQTNLKTSYGEQGHQVEHTFTIDDSCLPTSAELQAYKDINPGLIDFLLETSKKEQQHRHCMDKMKMKSIRSESRSVHNINYLGMTFAFLIMLFGLLLSAYLIYLDKIVVGTIFGGVTLLSAASLFINNAKIKK